MSRTNGDRPPAERGEPPPADLEPRQWIALRTRLTGGTMTEAADAAGVHRSTVYRWHEHDPEYRAAYNRLRREQQERLRQRLLEAAGEAVEAVERAVAAGDIERCFRLLEGVGVLDGQTPRWGPTDPAKIKQDVFLRGLEFRFPSGPDRGG